MNEIVVSILMITYNHEKYIQQAIEGVLNQHVDFDYELIICDDFSTDNTGNIVNRLIAMHPQGAKIKYFKHSENIGMQPNFIFAYEKCNGKYIAICEGDDYWSDDFKLQKQVTFLQTNPAFTICFHRVGVLELNKKIIEYPVKPPRTETTLKDLSKGNYIATLSVVFRNPRIALPEYFKFVTAGDYSLYIFLLQKSGGRIMYLEDCMGIYRKSDNATWSKLTFAAQQTKWVLTLDSILFYSHLESMITKNLLSQIEYGILAILRSQGDLDFVENIKHPSIKDILISALRDDNTFSQLILSDPKALAKKVSLKTLGKALIEKLRQKYQSGGN